MMGTYSLFETITTAGAARRGLLLAASTMALTTVLSAAPRFTSVWRSPDAATTNFAGKTLAALVITGDDSLRISGEEALVRELTARGLTSVATYRIAPKEELKNPDRAKGWFEKAGVEGVVAMRPVSKDDRTTYNPGIWMSPHYNSFWGYYGYGWGGMYVPGTVDRDTIVVVETTIYSVPRNTLLWAAVSETKNPKNLQQFTEELVKGCVKQLQERGMAGSLPK
jgi:hypothetical protein